ncbi:hypothetical protein WJX74_009284 [Apatococcus lobatus]|uniref:Uncharacterized protein n=1 Tax=Apatococcus lobatus TaxID=904363 RepID=A0AAW1QVR0_9CHLO
MSGLEEQALAANSSSLRRPVTQDSTAVNLASASVPAPRVVVPPAPQKFSAGPSEPAGPAARGHLPQPGAGILRPGVAAQQGDQDVEQSVDPEIAGQVFPDLLSTEGLPEPRCRRGSAVEASKRVASFIAQQNKSFKEEYLPEGSMKGVRKGKRKPEGSQDLDSSYTADGDEPWPGGSSADGALEHASKRHKSERDLKRRGQNQHTKRARMAEKGLAADGVPNIANGNGLRRRDGRQPGLLKSGKYGKRGPYNKSGGHPGDRKHHAKGSKAAKAATKKGALGVGARALKGAVPDVDAHAQDADAASRASPEPGPEDYDELYGCPKCRFTKSGCGACRQEALQRRLKSVRWRPSDGRSQQDIPLAPVFHPTAEEFKDPIAYLEKIRPEGERCGIVNIVPPDGWSPPFALDKGTNGQSADSFKFTIRQQLTSHLCMRLANTSAVRSGNAAGRYDAKKPDEEHLLDDQDETKHHVEEDGVFGFLTLEKPQTLKSFAAYGEWTKQLHFSDPVPKAGMQDGVDNAEEYDSAREGPSGPEEPSLNNSSHSTKRRKIADASRNPTLDEIEAEFWRIVESPDEVVESLYGQDLDSGHHGSGFPLPPFRQTMLEQHLTQAAEAKGLKDPGGAAAAAQRHFTDKETAYSKHAWNINNLPRCKGSVLRYLIGEELITGVMVPWLYVGTALSAFCWHVEDHALYSINYLHQGAPKVWYGVPAHASEALEEACKDALPHLFAAAPDLLYQLVTMVSPRQLQARGVPVYRVIHNPASFTVTFPNAYHSGFNTGFNIAEAVNFGPPDWIPYGTDVLDKYRKDRKAATLSHDNLLVSLVQGAVQVAAKQQRTASDAAACSTNAQASDAVDMDVEDSREEHVVLQLGPASKDGLLSVGLAVVPSNMANTTSSGAGKDSTTASGSLPQASGASCPWTAAGRPGPAVTPSGGLDSAEAEAAKMPGRATDLSFMDPINVEDAPTRAVQLAAGELALRIAEERRRRVVGLAGMPQLQARPMVGKPGAKNERGMHTDTEETDCEECKCDLYLFAVVSPMRPGRATCPEHAAVLNLPHHQMILLYRYTLEQLERMVQTAETLIPGTSEVIEQARKRRDLNISPNGLSRPVVRKLGPVAKLQDPKPGKPPKPVKAKKLPKDAGRPKKKNSKLAKQESRQLKAAASQAASVPAPAVPAAIKAAPSGKLPPAQAAAAAASAPQTSAAVPTAKAAPAAAAPAKQAGRPPQPTASKSSPAQLPAESKPMAVAAQSDEAAAVPEAELESADKEQTKGSGKVKKEAVGERNVKKAGRKGRPPKGEDAVGVKPEDRMPAPMGLPAHIAAHLPPKRSHKKMTPEQRAAVAAARAAAAGEPLPDLPALKALKPVEPASKKASKLKVKDGAVTKRKAAPAETKPSRLKKPNPLAIALRLSLETANAAKAGAASKKAPSSGKGKAAKANDQDSAGSPEKAASDADDVGEPADSEHSSDTAPAQGIPEGLIALFSPAKLPTLGPAVTGPSAEEGDADNNFPLPASFLQPRGCAPSEETSDCQLIGAGPHPAYPTVPRITAARKTSSVLLHAQGDACPLDESGQQGVQPIALPRRVRSRPGGPAAVSVEQSAAIKPPSAADPAAASPSHTSSAEPAAEPVPEDPSNSAAPVKPAIVAPSNEDSPDHAAQTSHADTSVPVAIDLDDEPPRATNQQKQQTPQRASGTQPFQLPLFDPFQHQQQQQTALLAHFASLPLHQWGDALGEYQRQALASLASNISAVQQVLAQASLLQQQQQQQATLQGMQALAARTPAVFLPRPQLSGLAGIVQQTVTPAQSQQPAKGTAAPNEASRAPAAQPAMQPPQPFSGAFGPASTSEAVQPAPQQVAEAAPAQQQLQSAMQGAGPSAVPALPAAVAQQQALLSQQTSSNAAAASIPGAGTAPPAVQPAVDAPAHVDSISQASRPGLLGQAAESHSNATGEPQSGSKQMVQPTAASAQPAAAPAESAPANPSLSIPQPKVEEAAEPIPGLPSSVLRSMVGAFQQKPPRPDNLIASLQSGQAAPAPAAASISERGEHPTLTAESSQEDEIIDIAADDDLPHADDPGKTDPSNQPAGRADASSRRTITGGAHPRIASWQPSPEAGLGSREAYGLWGNTPYNPPYPNGHAEPTTTSGWTVTSNWPNPQAPTQPEHTGWATAYPDMQSLIRYAQTAQSDAGAATEPMLPATEDPSSGPSTSHDRASSAQPSASSAPHAAPADVQMDGDELMGDGPWAEDFERFMAANLDGQQGTLPGGRQEAGPSLPNAEQSNPPDYSGWAWPPGAAGMPPAPERNLHPGPSSVQQHPVEGSAHLTFDNLDLRPSLDTKLLMMQAGQPSSSSVSQGL